MRYLQYRHFSRFGLSNETSFSLFTRKGIAFFFSMYQMQILLYYTSFIFLVKVSVTIVDKYPVRV